MNNTFTIRRADPTDLAAVWALCRAVKKQLAADGIPIWGEDYPRRDDFAADIAAGKMPVAVRDGKIIGSLAYNADLAGEYFFDLPAAEAGRRTAEMLAMSGAVPGKTVSGHRLMVDPHARQGGVAEGLLRALEAGCPGQWIVLFASPVNAPARRLYAKLGYRDIGEYTFGFGVMRYLVKPPQGNA